MFYFLNIDMKKYLTWWNAKETLPTQLMVSKKHLFWIFNHSTWEQPPLLKEQDCMIGWDVWAHEKPSENNSYPGTGQLHEYDPSLLLHSWAQPPFLWWHSFTSRHVLRFRFLRKPEWQLQRTRPLLLLSLQIYVNFKNILRHFR